VNEPDLLREDWELLKSFFPGNWRDLARRTNALKGLRQDKSEENLLRTLLIHLACGCSLRETALRARKARLAELSDVAVLKRLRKSQNWLYGLCCELFEQRGMRSALKVPFPMRMVDATLVKEPGKTGSLWRIHYSLHWPSLACDFFKLTAVEGEGTGESLKQVAVAKGDHLLADAGYCLAAGIHHVAAQGGLLTVRVNAQNLQLRRVGGGAFPLIERLAAVTKPMQIASWRVEIPSPQAGAKALAGRLCVIRKSEQAIRRAQKRLTRRASKTGNKLQAQTLLYAKYVIVFSTFSEEHFPAHAVLECYRLRWQIELVFKRFKQIADLGHLPKHDPESAKAWLYGKLFVALLTEELIAAAKSLSPWGYIAENPSHCEPVA
jgi:Transposase DDE domain